MAKQNEYSAEEQLKKSLEGITSEANEKKPFIEPELSPAVDVLEATTFLQTVESGGTN